MKNKKGEIDVRNILGIWSCVKWCVDMTLILAGGGILSHTEDMRVFSLVFILWIWSLIKLVADTPLVGFWAVGKVKWHRRKKEERLSNEQNK